VKRAAGRLFAMVAMLLPGCGDNRAPPRPDGGAARYTLQVLDPPGESIGLAFHDTTTLAVLYLDPTGRPVPDAPVSFGLIASFGEATGGATIAATQTTTDSAGAAQVDLVAGAERVNFRVQVSAADAQPVLFYIAVSQGGFTDLTVSPEHFGFRSPSDLDWVEVRLYRADQLRCDQLDIDDPPESLFPPRALDGFGGVVVYRNATAGEPFTLIGWASSLPDSARVSAGCVELGASQIRPGRPLHLLLPLRDRPPHLPARLDLVSWFDARPLVEAVGSAGPDPWAMLACPLGKAQLVIDCALDAQAPDGDVDCVVGGDSPLVTAVEGERGTTDANGCRPAQLAGGDASLDSQVQDNLSGPWPSGLGLTLLLAARRVPLTGFSLASQLDSTAGTAPLRHRLAELSVSSGAFAVDLVDSPRAIIRQTAPSSLDPASGRLELGDHRFTLDYGAFARDAFAALGLTPAGLAPRAGDLGAALFDSVDTGIATGCTALSDLVCDRIGSAASCLASACSSARPALDGLLDAWWQRLDATGLDFGLTGWAEVGDNDADMLVESLGADDGSAWTATLDLTSGSSVELPGAWQGSAE
jgi:hypothetical protein